MFQKLGEKCTCLMMQHKIIAQEDKELYEYAFEILFSQCANIILCFILGSIFHSALPTFLYLIFFVSLRSYAGGYHAPNYVLCYLESLLVIVAFLFIGNIVLLSLIPIVFLLAFSDIIIWLVAPIEDSNKPLSKIEMKSYKLKTRIIELVELVIMLISFLCDAKIKILFFMAASHYTVAFLLILSIITHYRKQ